MIRLRWAWGSAPETGLEDSNGFLETIRHMFTPRTAR